MEMAWDTATEIRTGSTEIGFFVVCELRWVYLQVEHCYTMGRGNNYQVVCLKVFKIKAMHSPTIPKIKVLMECSEILA